MTDDYQQSSEWAQQHRESLTTRHAHKDVLTDREFELLLEACSSLPEPKDLQTRFVCLAAGRLGLRAGEIAHFHTEWLDWERMLLRIPQHEPCDCGYCRRQATQETTHNDELTHEDAMEARWHPKTVASARSIPIDLSLPVGTVSGTVHRSVRCVSTVTQCCEQTSDGRRRGSRHRRPSVSARSPSDCSQLSCISGSRTGSAPSTDGLERFGNGTEVHPHFRQSDGRRSPAGSHR